LWPPTGIALVCLLFWGLRCWPGITLGAFLVNIAIWPSPLPVAMICIGNTLAPVCAWLLLRWARFRVDLAHMRDALALVFLGAFAGMAVSATNGAAVLAVFGALPADQIWPTWSVWWAGDAMGVLIVAPFVLAVRAAWPLRAVQPRRLAEAAALAVIALGLAVLATNAPAQQRLLFLVFPAVVWAAVRFRLVGATSCALAISTLAALAAAQRTGPFAGLDMPSAMIILHAFNASVALTGLLLAVVTVERDQARLEIERACVDLADTLAKVRPGYLLEGLHLTAVRRAQAHAKDSTPLPNPPEPRQDV
jgi:integral membrane sensor domain MASE1